MNSNNSYSLTTLGYYSNGSTDPNVELELRINKNDLGPNTASSTWSSSHAINSSSMLDILSYDYNTDTGSYEKLNFADLVSQATVWQIRSSYTYTPEYSENPSKYYYSNSTNPSPTSAYKYYIFALDFSVGSETYTYFFKLQEYAPYSPPPSVPVPGAVWLMGTGVAGLMAIRHRKVNK